MDFSCVFGSLSHGKFPEKDCLLPLISKLLGYCIVAASTTVKLPQATYSLLSPYTIIIFLSLYQEKRDWIDFFLSLASVINVIHLAL